MTYRFAKCLTLLLVLLAYGVTACVSKTVSMDTLSEDKLKGQGLLVVRHPTPVFQVSNTYDVFIAAATAPFSLAAIPFADDYAELKGASYQKNRNLVDPTNRILADVGRYLSEKFEIKGAFVHFVTDDSEGNDKSVAEQKSNFDYRLEVQVPWWGIGPNNIVTSDYSFLYSVKMTLIDNQNNAIIGRRQCVYRTPGDRDYEFSEFQTEGIAILGKEAEAAIGKCRTDLTKGFGGHEN